MGFLNHLLRRQRSVAEQSLNEASFLKAQSYESTTASSPPILGTYPVPGNGSNPILIAANQQSLQVQLLTGDVTSRRLPLSRLRSSTLSRPGTAGSATQSETLARPRTSSGPSLAARPDLQSLIQAQRTDGPPYKLSAKDSSLDYQLPPPKPWVDREASKRNSLAGRTTTISSTSSIPTSIGNHRSTSSMGSRSKTHVDLLDATIRPLDFYDRVAATGAKTYGEDVADRNSMLSVTSPPPTAPIDQQDTQGPRKRLSMGHSLRTSSLRPISQVEDELLEMTHEASRDAELIAKRKADKAARRQSMPVPPSKESPAEIGETLKTPKDEPAAFPVSLKEKAAAMARNELAIIRATAAMQKPGGIILGGTQETSSTIAAAQPATSTMEQSHSTEMIAAQYTSPARTRSEAPVSASRSNHDVKGVGSPSRAKQTGPRRDSKQPRSRNVSGASLTMSSIKQFDLDNPIPDRSSSLRNWSMTSGSITAYTHDYDSNPFRPQSSHTTKTSVDLTPISPAFKISSPSQTSFHSPISPSSFDHWQPNAEPSTRHHTLKRSPLGPDTRSSKPKHAPAQPTTATESFHIDDYVSSDDSFGSPKRNRGDEERDLLFSDDSFGLTFQLPGISSPLREEFSEPSRSMTSQTLSLSAFNDFSGYGPAPSFGQVSSVAPRGHGQSDSRPAGTRGKHYNFSMPTFHDHDWAEGEDSGVDADSEDEFNMDIPMRRAPPQHQHHQYSLARLQHQGHRVRIEDDYDYYKSGTSRSRHDRHAQPQIRDGQRTRIRDY
ncbi:uncharacterized protein B0I36DRAFT_362981 [Microdochium trichocladiopsis]|uniref:Uncharacterized protein n=1 Tax=Microdochium trichocladiopsis TaxID=1682393 RepID=A0A9P8Y4X8_9PEZI|nr:uncharacterized protein B0I36DRAFT_362981 [Microdochium trichocladiopsis]KAH7031267.1 hypothetical protein B0I36DRAFT_362981 [Microdochium trichocladiopsis]